MGKKILLAEDSLTIQKVFELAFAQSDVSLTVVDNGNDAVRLAGETSPDLVVADVTLPGRDGYQVAEELRLSEKTRQIPVLILSGTLSPFDEDRFRKSGAGGIVFKPFESQELADKVQALLRARDEGSREEKEARGAAADEPWDFSDVLEEVNQEARKSAAAPQRGEDLLSGAVVEHAREAGGVSLGEFDVSLEELDAPAGRQAAEAPIAAAEEVLAEAPIGTAAEPDAPVAHIEGDPLADAPVAVTDLSPALEVSEELEEIEDLEEVELLRKESLEAPAGAVPAPEPARERIAAVSPASPTRAAMESAMREEFSARAREIFEKVAAETVEKVLWETMDRFSVEFSARIRESVEAVAWEVIPTTAEALIREEIARIREQTAKKSS